MTIMSGEIIWIQFIM